MLASLQSGCSTGLVGVPRAGRAGLSWACGWSEPPFIVLSGLSAQVCFDGRPKVQGTGGAERQELAKTRRQSSLAPRGPVQGLHVCLAAEGAAPLASLQSGGSARFVGVPCAWHTGSSWACGWSKPPFIVLSGFSAQVCFDGSPKVQGTGGAERQELAKTRRQSSLASRGPVQGLHVCSAAKRAALLAPLQSGGGTRFVGVPRAWHTGLPCAALVRPCAASSATSVVGGQTLHSVGGSGRPCRGMLRPCAESGATSVVGSEAVHGVGGSGCPCHRRRPRRVRRQRRRRTGGAAQTRLPIATGRWQTGGSGAACKANMQRAEWTSNMQIATLDDEASLVLSKPKSSTHRHGEPRRASRSPARTRIEAQCCKLKVGT